VKGCVVDASVAAKWYFPEEHSDIALRLMPTGQEDGFEVVAPELIVYEMGSLVLKKLRVGDVGISAANSILKRFLSLPLRMVASAKLAQAALDLGYVLRLSYYDAWYLAAAVDLGRVLVTADREVVALTRGTPFADSVRVLPEFDL